MRTFAVGDIHGGHRSLLQVVERAGVDRERDTLVVLGDVADGWPQTREVIDELLTFPHLVHLLGNHDAWFRDWVQGGEPLPLWTRQGGQATIDSYGGSRDNVPAAHRTYLEDARLWYEQDGRMFVHGGWSWERRPHPSLDGDAVLWDRSLWDQAYHRGIRNTRTRPLTQFREVFLGHTSLSAYGLTVPSRGCEVWNLDTGGGWEGRLSIMDVETKEFWQSDPVRDLYPEHGPRATLSSKELKRLLRL